MAAAEDVHRLAPTWLRQAAASFRDCATRLERCRFHREQRAASGLRRERLCNSHIVHEIK